MLDSWQDIASVLFLVVCFISVGVLIAHSLLSPGRYSVIERITYAPVYTLARLLWRVEVQWDARWGEGPSERHHEKDMLRDRLRTGGVLIANHRSSVDPFFVQLAAGCRVHWMVAGEYFRHFLFGPLLRSYQAIPTNRGGMDNAATKRAIEMAAAGDFVGMFPEGRINRTDCPLLSIRPGAALVASRARVPLIPIWIEGAPVGPEVYSALLMPARVRVLIGFPNEQSPTLNLTSENSSSDGSDSILRADRQQKNEWICQVMEECLRLGGKSNSEIVIAGKRWVDS
jgi:1-acyl-sn-glycerol-3-phosphate acyltransferase